MLLFQECEVREGGLAEVGKLVHLISLFRLNNKPEQVSPLHGVDGYYHTCVHSSVRALIMLDSYGSGILTPSSVYYLLPFSPSPSLLSLPRLPPFLSPSSPSPPPPPPPSSPQLYSTLGAKAESLPPHKYAGEGDHQREARSGYLHRHLPYVVEGCE